MKKCCESWNEKRFYNYGGCKVKYHVDALEIIKDNYLLFLVKEYKNFVINVKVYETAKVYFSLYEDKESRTFIDFGHENFNVTYSEVFNMLSDNEDEESLYTICSENTFKNFVSILEDYLKEVLLFLFNSEPEKVFHKDGSIKLNELLRYESIEQIKDHLIEKKVIDVSYNSLAEMIRYIEDVFKIKFEIDPDIIQALKEITNIRNILVHNKGVVNELFLEKQNGKESFFFEESYEKGIRLIIGVEGMEIIFEMLSKLGKHIFDVLDSDYKNK